jgi:hypothetical protein
MAIENTIFHGELPLVLSKRETETGLGELDAVAIEVLVDDNWRSAAAAAGYGKGMQVAGYYSMWVNTREGEQDSDDTALVSVQCLGLIDSGDKRKRTIGVMGRVVAVGPIEKVILVTNKEETAEDPDGGSAEAKRRIPKLDGDGEVQYKTIVTPTGSADRWNINEPTVTITDEYFATSKPDTNLVGLPFSPPSPPTPPAYQWSGYGEPMRANHPNGWVLDEREIETIYEISAGLGLWRVVDRVAFYQTFLPD